MFNVRFSYNTWSVAYTKGILWSKNHSRVEASLFYIMVFIYWHIHSIESISFEKKGLFRITLFRAGSSEKYYLLLNMVYKMSTNQQLKINTVMGLSCQI